MIWLGMYIVFRSDPDRIVKSHDTWVPWVTWPDDPTIDTASGRGERNLASHVVINNHWETSPPVPKQNNIPYVRSNLTNYIFNRCNAVIVIDSQMWCVTLLRQQKKNIWCTEQCTARRSPEKQHWHMWSLRWHSHCSVDEVNSWQQV